MFTHLHTHTEYSLLDGAAKIKPLVEKAKSLEQKALAITDHRNMFGCVEFYSACVDAGIKPVIGCEFNVVSDIQFKEEGRGNHLVLLAKNQQGYRNLCILVTLSNRDGFYYVPRIDKKMLKEHTEGLICLSACIQGEIPKLIIEGKQKEAEEAVSWYKELFGEDFYLEVQDHGMPTEAVANEGLKRLAKLFDIKIVATNDVHYIEKQDADAQDSLMCIQTGKLKADTDRLRFPSDEFYLKSEKEMLKLFPQEWLDNTQEIVDKCTFEYTFGQIHLPFYEVPGEFSSHEAYLRDLCVKGLKRRYGEDYDEEVRNRYEYEMSVISEMGYVDYFLIVWDFINWAKSKGIPIGPGRGSGAGSIVAYAVGITNVDPLRYHLYFERFLNPERVSMPGFDIDMCVERRGEIVEYVKAKYGIDHVSQIATYATLKAKNAIKSVAKILNIPLPVSNEIAGMIGNSATIDEALEANPELKKRYDNDANIKYLIDSSKKIEGLKKNTSSHAAGVLICDSPITDHAPLHVDDNGGYIIEADMSSVEKLGLLKFDFLGLRNLTVEQHCIDDIKRRTGKVIDLDEIPLDDPKVYKMLASGDSNAVFQFESDELKGILKQLQPTRIEDLIALNALYRPGPMAEIPTFIERKHHPEKIEYLDEKLRPILEETNGCLVYQEQVMKMFQSLAGFSLGRADIVRRAMSKKKKAVIDEEKEIFIHGLKDKDGNVLIEGALARGVSEEVCHKLMDMMTAFASYAFNKSHAAAYSIIAYQTAWLKCYYPIEYMCAVINSYDSGNDAATKRSKYLAYVKNGLKIPVLAVDINSSQAGLSKEGNAIRFGFETLSGVGRGIAENIVEERRISGPYKSIFDFAARCKKYKVNKTALEALILTGAFDYTGYNRKELVGAIEQALAYKPSNADENQLSMFSEGEKREPEIKRCSDYSSDEKALKEFKAAKTFLTCSPLDTRRNILNVLQLPTLDKVISDLSEGRGDRYKEEFTVVAIFSEVKKSISKNKKKYAKANLLGSYAVATGLIFEKVLNKCDELVQDNRCVLIKCKWNGEDENNPTFFCNYVEEIPVDDNLEAAKTFISRNQKYMPKELVDAIQKPQIQTPKVDSDVKAVPGLYVKIEDTTLLDKVVKTVIQFKGNSPFYIYIPGKKLYKNDNLKVSEDAVYPIQQILGEKNVIYIKGGI